MAFDDIPEDREQSFQCPQCENGDITLNKDGEWECDSCDFCVKQEAK